MIQTGRRLVVSALALTVFVATLAGLGAAAGAAEAPAPSEYEVKAAYLLNFAKFVEWPAKKFDSPDAPIVIGVIGEDPFGEALDRIVQNKLIKGKRLVVRRFATREGLSACHVLFVSRSETARLDAILAQVGQAGVLTVGDSEKFAHRGGIINFVLIEQQVKIELNLQAAERAGLQLSSRLSAVAKLVPPKADGKSE